MSLMDEAYKQFDNIKKPQKYIPMKEFNEFTEIFGQMPGNGIQYLYHGSPVDNLKEFDLGKVGSLNGSYYGKGIYTGGYSTALSYADDIDGSPLGGHLYKVQIPRDEYLYDANKPFRYQSKYVRDKIINWEEIPKNFRKQWADMLLGRANPHEEGLTALGNLKYEGDLNSPGGILEKMGIHGKKVKVLGVHEPYRIIFNPTYAKIVDKLFGVMDPWSMSDMLKMGGNDPRAVFGSKKEKNKMLQEINEAGYTVERQPDGTLLFKI